MPGPSFVKDPQARLDYGIDWSAWLGDDMLASSTWTTDPVADLDAEPTALVIEAPTILGSTTRVWALGGTEGTIVTLVNHISTTQGREEDRSLFLAIEQR